MYCILRPSWSFKSDSVIFKVPGVIFKVPGVISKVPVVTFKGHKGALNTVHYCTLQGNSTFLKKNYIFGISAKNAIN